MSAMCECFFRFSGNLFLFVKVMESPAYLHCASKLSGYSGGAVPLPFAADFKNYAEGNQLMAVRSDQ